MDLQKILKELSTHPGMLWVIGGGAVVSENGSEGMKEPAFDGGYATIEGHNWHFHLKTDSVTGVQFVEAEDHGIPFLYYVRFSDQEETMLRVYFPNPYLDENEKPAEFQPDRLKAFEEVRDKYVNHEDVVFVKRTRQTSG